jgi:hypothetical protein
MQDLHPITTYKIKEAVCMTLLLSNISEILCFTGMNILQLLLAVIEMNQ